jgi:signal transduction histidine kinase
LKLNNYEIKGAIKVGLLFFAFLIGFSSLWFTNSLVKKLASQERDKIATWANATRQIASSEGDNDINFIYEIIQGNTTIPVILTNEKGEVIGSRNLDSTFSVQNKKIEKKIEAMKAQNEPIEVLLEDGKKNIIYYENSLLLSQLKVYPYFQLGVIGLFLAMSYFAFSYSRTSEQNKVWAGMSKETAHQLGTPISSLMGWVDYLKESENNVPQKVLDEIDHDMQRLSLITERFSKIGSEPTLATYNLYNVLQESVSYINNRTSVKVDISIKNEDVFKMVTVNVNKPLFAWVVENLCKNAVDAMDGEGIIYFEMEESLPNAVVFDVVDNGKGIAANKFKTIFKPGYTTKKRGWGLGLSLVKRIIENYHSGKIYVKSSELGKGTRFRIELNTHV